MCFLSLSVLSFPSLMSPPIFSLMPSLSSCFHSSSFLLLFLSFCLSYSLSCLFVFSTFPLALIFHVPSLLVFPPYLPARSTSLSFLPLSSLPASFLLSLPPCVSSLPPILSPNAFFPPFLSYFPPFLLFSFYSFLPLSFSYLPSLVSSSSVSPSAPPLLCHVFLHSSSSLSCFRLHCLPCLIFVPYYPHSSSRFLVSSLPTFLHFSLMFSSHSFFTVSCLASSSSLTSVRSSPPPHGLASH